ncbi:Disease resistance protein [Corchorus olitorius]|uniref:Disease resistance protein n=1 Tax=Corchorus olitorius TaxID=93759 RepID=A0A1R3GY26_9ROSI|nr:Disease resistance protein [Corchorus olitorius]
MDKVLPLIPVVAQGTAYISYISDHIFNPDKKVEKLKKEVDKLKNARNQVQQSVDVAIKNEEEILDGVHRWIIEVDKKITEEAAKITKAEEKAQKRCFMDLCPNFISRYHLRKEVDKEAKAITGLLKDGEFDRVAQIPASEISFESRQHVLDAIMNALKDADVNRIGIYGMAGVGKSAFIKEVSRQAKESKLFDAVVLVDVTKTNSDIKGIQEEIADKVGLEFTNEISTTHLRADRLHQKLKFTKNLVILDDIRSRLNLNEIGIPFRDEMVTCKILLTSRDLNVLSSEMGIEHNFGVGVLTEEEAWDLFKNMTGNVAEHPYLLSTAKEVARRCAGLPLAIVTVAKVLKNKSYIQWKAALNQLKGPQLSNFSEGSSSRNFNGVPADVYSAIKLSYDYLESEEHKLTFLLCSLLGRKTTMFNLVTYAMGLGLFQGIITLEDARVKAETLINQLKSSYLLLDGFSYWQFSIHDVVRDVAMSIPFRGGQMLSLTSEVTLKEWEDKIYANNCTAISLLENESIELPEELDCPQLQFFHISSKDSSLKVPDRFFAQTREIKVLDLTNMNLSPLPSSITQLSNLCTLRLDKCVLEDIAIIGKLQNVEILSLQLATIEELPEDIKQLTKLKSLNLSKTKIKVIPPNLLSSLCKLEQLYLCESFVEWETEGGKNACFSELKNLSCLTSLEFHIPKINIIPKDLFHERLERFKIFIGEAWNWSGFLSTRTLKLKLDTRLHQDRGIRMLLKKSDALYLNLDELKGVKSLLYELDHEGFPDLKYLHVKTGSNIEYIIHCKQWIISQAFPLLESLFLYNLTNLKQICHGQLLPGSFSRLKIIKVGNCKRLENLFSYSLAKMLLQLEEIEVTGCDNVTEIISKERDDNIDNNEPVFCQLRSLRLQSLAKLICFCSRDVCPSTTSSSSRSERSSFPGENLQSSCFPNHIFWSSRSQRSLCSSCRDMSIETTNTRSTDMTPFNQKIFFPCEEFTSFRCLQNLTSLVIKDCKTPEYMFSVSMAATLMQLKSLEINDCDMMGVILVREGTEQIDKVSFPQLNSLKLKALHRLQGFCSGNSILIEFPALKRLEIDQCSELKEFIFKSVGTDKNPEDTDFDSSLRPLFGDKVTFPSLETMILRRLKNMTQIYHSQLATDSFCKLRLMRVRICEKGIPIEGPKAEVATQLTKLYLSNLPNLKFVWNKDPRGILAFENLQLVSADRCKSLKHLFPTSVARGLSQLEILEVKECGVEEIVAKEEGLEKLIEFGFPHLSTLELCHLKNLKCFYSGTHTIDWPVLKRLVASHCQKVKIFGTGNSNNEANVIDQQQPLFLFEKVFHQLDELSLNCHDIAAITYLQLSMDDFHYVKVLRVACYHDESHDEISGLSCFLQRFYNLEKLVVDSCKFAELFPNEKMPAETSIHSQELISPIYQKLESLEVWECDNLSSLAPSSACFQSLTTLDVWNCQGMIKLISSSTARTLVQLMDMRILECNGLTEIVAEKEDGMEDDEIIFQNLKFLKLQSLQKLTSFCGGNSVFNFPTLKQVIIEQCPNMNSFCRGKLITGKLKVMPREGRGKGHQTDDLNATIKRLHEGEKEQMGF